MAPFFVALEKGRPKSPYVLIQGRFRSEQNVTVLGSRIPRDDALHRLGRTFCYALFENIWRLRAGCSQVERKELE